MDSSDNAELMPHGYFIRHGGSESGPFDMRRLRRMWAAGEIDQTTKFKRADWSYWGDAEDILVELEFTSPDEVEVIIEEETVKVAVEANKAPRIEEPRVAMPAPIPVRSEAASSLKASGDLSHVSKPYKQPILYWLLVTVAALTVLAGLGIMIGLGGGERGVSAAAAMATFPVFLFAIAAFGFAQLVDYLGRTSHFTQQSAELLHRELPALRKALESARRD